LGPGFEDDAVCVTIEGEAAGGNDVTVVGPDVSVNDRHGARDVLDAKNPNFKSVNRLNVTGGGGVEGVVVDDRRAVEEFINWGVIKEIKGEPVHDFANEGRLKGAAGRVQVFGELWVKGLCLCKGIHLKVNPSSAIGSFAYLPFDLETVDSGEHVAYSFKKIRSGLLSNVGVDREEDIIDGVAFVASDNANRDKGGGGML
jgi:hypothetical protein